MWLVEFMVSSADNTKIQIVLYFQRNLKYIFVFTIYPPASILSVTDLHKIGFLMYKK